MEIQWSLVVFTVLTGAAGWMLACVALDEFKRKAEGASFPAAVVAIALAVAGGLASVTHLSHPDRMLAALGHPTSGIFTEAVLVGLTAVCALAYVVLLKRGASASARKALAVLAAVFGVVLAFASGASYMMSSQLSWNTPLLPVAYGFTAMPAGVALYLVTAKLRGCGDLGLYARILAVSGAAAAVSAALFALVSGAASAGAALWAVAVVVGGVAPAVCGLVAAKKPARLLELAAAGVVAALAGSAALRCAMWATSVLVNNFFGQI